ncbi:leucine-rich repeat flightless-interacting protein 2 isoform X18 [Pseudoliparis swirei]|uniref:leucine-rich repeat flightless-interacting protein 2 isoform X18 n=1 Tax=Pseudoliparis swirei TaxID=2059687 RepID=UPI0024BE3BFE|nr:leucine-rich repeat flightless-interacting protein 2 isoform X18 [Pseudoliparis swirei]
MGTQGSGRKRAPLKDRFSAEDEALSSIAREAEARLAAKRAARAEARDIRMRELERQQKERSYLSSSGSNRKWGQIHQWMADSDKARGSSSGSVTSRHRRGLEDDVMSACSYRSTSSSAARDAGSTSRSSTRRKDVLSDGLSSSSTLKTSRSSSSVYSDLLGHRRSSSSASRKDLLTGLYHDQRNYSSLTKTKATPPTSTSTYRPRLSSKRFLAPLLQATTASSSSVGPALPRSYSMASVYEDAGLLGSSSRPPSALSWYSSSTRSSPVLDEKCDKQFTDFSRPSSRCATPSLSPATLASLGGSSSRRGSADAGSAYDPDSSLSELRDIYELKDQIQDVEGRYMQGLKELKESLAEVEEKYKKAMVSNAQLDNDKGNLIYQVDTLKDVIEEMEEHTAETRRELEDKAKELERQKHTCTVLQHKQEELKEGIRQRDELIEESQRTQTKLDGLTREVFDLQETINWKDKKIGALERQKEYFDCIRSERDELRDDLAAMKQTEKHGLVIIPDGTPNGDVNHEPLTSGITVVSQEAAQVLESAGEGPLDVRLRKLAEEKDELLSQIRKLKAQLEDERQKHSKTEAFTDGERAENGTDLHAIEMQRDANRQISEYKFKISKAEQEMGTMEQNINRLEGQVSRYKSSADNSEKVEDELKVEKRKLQRELRTALDKIEEMEMTNNHLVKRLEKMKANRNALLSQQ